MLNLYTRKNTTTQQPLAQLQAIASQLNSAHAEFQRAATPTMTEAAVFAINGLNARYGALLQQIKASETSIVH